MPIQNPKSPQSVIGKICAILDQFTLETPVLTLREITEKSNIPRTSTRRILHDLADEGWVQQTSDGYQLGMKLIQLGQVARTSLKLVDLIEDLVRPFAEEIEETVITATIERNEAVYIHAVEAPSHFRFVAKSGERRPIHYGATGLALLACLTEPEQRALIPDTLTAYTPKTITDKSQRLAQLKTIGYDRIIIERGEFIEGVQAIAVPIKTNPPLSITVVGSAESIQLKQAAIVHGLRKLGRDLEQFKTGFDY